MVVPSRHLAIQVRGVAAVLCGVLVATLCTAAAAGADQEQGEQLYRNACASCHGADGSGAPASFVGFDTPLPDFTDCVFASREPAADWVDVAAHGGPVRSFSELMPAFGEVLSDEQLTSVVAYVKGLCSDDRWPPGALNLPRALVTEKAYPEDEAVLSLAVDEDAESITAKVIYEKRFGARNQLEIVVPIGWRDLPAHGRGSDGHLGFGDVAVGIKRNLYHSLERGSIFSVTGEVILPSGDEDHGLGKGTTIFEPFLTYGQILPADFFMHGQAGLELPADRDRAEREAFLRLALGRSFVAGSGRVFSPMIEVLGARELVSGEQTSWDYVPQVQLTLSNRQHVMMSIGVRCPLTDSSQRQTQIIAYLLWDWFDGGFFDGW